MESDVWLPESARLSDDHIKERRAAARSSLANPALIWRSRDPDEPIVVRLLNHSEQGMAFICPLPLEPGETLDLALELNDTRRTHLHVANCEYLAEDTFRIGAHI